MSKQDIELVWDLKDFDSGINKVRNRFDTSIMILCNTAAIKMENYAKENAPWTDRTGNARQRLEGVTRWVGRSEIEIIVQHHMSYGFWLELAHERRYAILEEAIEENVEELYRSLRRFMGG